VVQALRDAPVVATLGVGIVNGDPADVESLIEFLREEGHEAGPAGLELRESPGIGEIIVQVLGGTASALYITDRIQTWVGARFARRQERPSGVHLLGPDGEPLRP